MFNKKHNFIVESYQVIDFVRLLGRIGLRFSMSDEFSNVDELNPDKKVWYRKFTVYGRRKDMDKLFFAVNMTPAWSKH
jgi:hypothetical protein